MPLQEQILSYLSNFNGSLDQKEGLYIFRYSVGSRDTALTHKAVTYTAKFRILEDNNLVRFTEIVKESSSGIGAGEDLAPGLSYKKESYQSGADGRSGDLQEQSSLGNNTLSYSLNYQEIRNTVKRLAEQNGYQFKYKILPWGI